MLSLAQDPAHVDASVPVSAAPSVVSVDQARASDAEIRLALKDTYTFEVLVQFDNTLFETPNSPDCILAVGK
jgi:hypothetical protein